MQRSSPLVSTGVIRFEASHDAAEAAPAPITVWILVDEENRARLLLHSAITLLSRFSKSPRYLRAARSASSMSAGIDSAIGQHVGDLPSTIMRAQAFGNSRLADAGFADVQRIVLAAAAWISMVRSTSSVRPISDRSCRPAPAG